jgi:hypothetical protein
MNNETMNNETMNNETMNNETMNSDQVIICSLFIVDYRLYGLDPVIGHPIGHGNFG